MSLNQQSRSHSSADLHLNASEDFSDDTIITKLGTQLDVVFNHEHMRQLNEDNK